MYAVEAEEDCLIGELKWECASIIASYSYGLERIEIPNERAIKF